MNPTKTKVGITTITTFDDGGLWTEKFLRSLVSSSCFNLVERVTVVVNGAMPANFRDIVDITKSSVECREKFLFLASASSKVESIAKGWNAGTEYLLKETPVDVVAVMNNDIVVTNKWLNPLVSVLERDPSIGIVCPDACEGPSYPNFGGSYTGDWKEIRDFNQEAQEREKAPLRYKTCLGYLYGPCFLVRREVFQKVGVFETAFGQYYFEDTDFAIRVGKAGIPAALVYNSLIYHKSSATISREWKEPERRQIADQANLAFFKKHNIRGPLPAGRTLVEHEFTDWIEVNG